MRGLACLLPLLACLCLPLAAQEKDDKAPPKPAGRLAWLVATSLPEDFPNPVDVLTGKDITQVTLSKRLVSEPPVKVPADGIVRLVRKTDNPANPAQPVLQTLAQAQIPDGVTKALIIMVPIQKAEGQVVMGTRVQSLANFKGGDCLYLNLTRTQVAVRLGTDQLTLKPGDTRIHHAPRLAQATNTPVSYHFLPPEGTEWQLLSASTIVLHPTRREICIFRWDPNFQRVDYHGVTFPVSPE